MACNPITFVITIIFRLIIKMGMLCMLFIILRRGSRCSVIR